MSTSSSSEIPELAVPLSRSEESLRVVAAQARPVWLDSRATADKAIALIEQAAGAEADVVVFPEAFLPGYAWWVPRTDGARFEAPDQRAAYAYYLEAAVEIGGEELQLVGEAAADFGVTVYLGTAERGVGSGRGTVYCTLVVLEPGRGVVMTHRKLVPTYDERLVWGYGDGYGLGARDVGGLRVSALNCWENLMPLARHAAYADGTDVHISLWPGSPSHTEATTRFFAYEGRVWSLGVCGLYLREDIPDDFPLAEKLREWVGDLPFTGGTALAAPTGEWVIEPLVGEERLVVCDLDPQPVRSARLDFDPTGHYARPDVFDVRIDRTRRTAASFVEESHP